MSPGLTFVTCIANCHKSAGSTRGSDRNKQMGEKGANIIAHPNYQPPTYPHFQTMPICNIYIIRYMWPWIINIIIRYIFQQQTHLCATWYADSESQHDDTWECNILKPRLVYVCRFCYVLVSLYHMCVTLECGSVADICCSCWLPNKQLDTKRKTTQSGNII